MSGWSHCKHGWWHTTNARFTCSRQHSRTREPTDADDREPGWGISPLDASNAGQQCAGHAGATTPLFADRDHRVSMLTYTSCQAFHNFQTPPMISRRPPVPCVFVNTEPPGPVGQPAKLAASKAAAAQAPKKAIKHEPSEGRREKAQRPKTRVMGPPPSDPQSPSEVLAPSQGSGELFLGTLNGP